METKQTALMWLESKLNSIKPTDFCSIETVRDWVNQAKEMEKEQMKGLYIEGAFAQLRYVDGKEFITSEQYYNETYGK